jgi:hypothetical protein
MKASKATIRARIEDLARVIADGAMPFQILRYVADAEAAGEAPWTVPEGGKGLCRRTIQNYVNEADKLLAEENRQHRKRRRRRHMAKLQSLYARCVNKGDERTARAILHDLAEIEGLLGDETARQIEELRRDIEELKGARHAGSNGAAKPGGPPAAVGHPEGEPAHPAAATAERGPEPPAHGRRPDAGRMADGPTPLF